MSKRKKPAPTHTIQAFWPVIGAPVTTIDECEELLTDAVNDLNAVALRHRAHITGPGKGYLAPGRDFPGAHGARQVIVIEAPATPMPPRGYHHTPGRNIT
ncbi:hypothetical protein E5206_09510 [Arthrobacter sp. PAMC25564]|uniref:hypothetical protein n=1 Tax=Arthrobacter sp. PAMC25564 TaxID=2565366 RepID=UPI0010A23653|nr:hypothetical protein [Arthrobacter sp. PAMC25564]QCB97139.1 hypothetical protein E5206_09510 [Arthrobacter sp. PAMC25564]